MSTSKLGGIMSLRLCQAIRVICCLTVVALVLLIFVKYPGINAQDGIRGFHDMVYGKAHKPYVYRALVPVTVRLATPAIPVQLRDSIDRFAGENSFICRVFSALEWEIEYFVEYCIASVLLYLSLLGFVLALRYLGKGVFQAEEVFHDIAALVSLVVLPTFFEYFSYLYDFPNLFLFTLGLALMVRRKWRWFLLVFVLACLNKETAILLTFIFVIHFQFGRRLERGLAGRLLVAQLAVFSLIKVAVTLIFRDNPGPFLEFHLFDHNFYLLKPYPPSSVAVPLAVAVLVFHKWSEKPAFLKSSLWILVPLFWVGLFFGQLDEGRAFYEAYPILVLLTCYSLAKILDVGVVTLEARTTRGYGSAT